MNEQYKEIINLPHHVSEKRPHMSMIDRAAQFSPFAALTGHDAALDETARLTDTFIELDEDEKQIIGEKIRKLIDNIEEKTEITVIWFRPDEKKDGGAYLTVTGHLKKADILKHEIIMNNGTVIPMEFIYEIRGEI